MRLDVSHAIAYIVGFIENHKFTEKEGILHATTKQNCIATF